MTLREFALRYLTDNMLWPEEAEAVLEAYIKTENHLQNRWDEDIAGYPESLLSAVYLGLDHEAISYIDQNKPKHFARSMFL